MHTPHRGVCVDGTAARLKQSPSIHRTARPACATRADHQAVAHRSSRLNTIGPEQRRHVSQERAKGESVRHLARVLGVSKATIARIEPAEVEA